MLASGVAAERAEQPKTASPGCLIDDPVRLIAVRGPGGRAISLSDRPVLACRFAAMFAAWSADAGTIFAQQKGGAPIAIRTGPGWDCRGVNRQAGARLSAHATGKAIDVSGFEWPGRSRLDFNLGTRSDAALQAVRASACALFTTVLSPGLAAFHDTHLHVDMQQHGRDNSYRICQ